MKKVFLAAFAALIFTLPAFGQYPPPKPQVVNTSLFGIAEQRQIGQLQQQMNQQQAANNAAMMQMFLAQQQQQSQQNAAMMQLLIASMNKQASPAAPQAQPPINIYLPPQQQQPYQGPRLDPNPGTPKLDPNPGTPKMDPNPGVPKFDPTPGVPKIDGNPGTPKMDLNPGGTPKMNPSPGTVPPPVGFQRLTNDRPPVITSTITDRYGVTRPAPAVVWQAGK